MLTMAAVVQACTGITLVAKDGSVIQARTEEWGAFNLESELMVIPRGTEFTGLTPDGKPGLKWKATYGVVSFNALGQASTIDGMNEKGLACSVLYLPRDTQFSPYDPVKASSTIGPQDVANWILTTQTDVEGVREYLPKINVVPVKEKGLGDIPPPIHFLVSDRTGKTIVIQYVHGKVNIYDNPVGVLTNSPEFPWHLTNLNNYIGLTAGAKQEIKVGELELSPFGVGTGMLGLPGDFSPPSRFVRAVAYRNTVRPLESGYEGAMEALRILNNFDIPSGAVSPPAELPTDDTLGSTQWTTAMGY
jgi:choloylglycine hydrolase